MAPSLRALAAVFGLLALLATACGSSASTEAGAPVAETDSAETDSAETDSADEGAANDDIRHLEVLDVTTGEATTLASTADGDRPVLLWFWAPH